MKPKIYIGADNGITASWGITGDIEPMFFKVPVFKQLSFQKTKATNISRIDTKKLIEILTPLKEKYDVKAFLERPMINPTRWNASISAVRALEATLIVLELLDIPIDYLDSKKWQQSLLPKGIKGSAELKKASKDIAIRLFPQHKELISKHKDGDGLLISEYARRNNL